jgi:hypothetical protein
MTSVTLTSMANPHVTVDGKLLTLEGRYAEVAVDGEAPFGEGALVQFQTPQQLYLGEIESGSAQPDGHRFRVLIEHSVDLERAAAIRRLWNTDSIL